MVLHILMGSSHGAPILQKLNLETKAKASSRFISDSYFILNEVNPCLQTNIAYVSLQKAVDLFHSLWKD